MMLYMFISTTAEEYETLAFGDTFDSRSRNVYKP